MIPNEKNRRLVLSCSKKKLSALLIKTTSIRNGAFYCLNWLRSFRTKNKLKPREKVFKNKNFCGILMLCDVQEFNQYMKLHKVPNIIYADLESLIKKIDGCENNPEKSSTTKIGENIPCGCSLSAVSAFNNIENKHTLYSG